jgi:hypothetical protein
LHAALKRWGAWLLSCGGYEIKRIQATTGVETPELHDDPLAAMHLARGGAKAAIVCPLELMCDLQGFSFGAQGWHPLVASIARDREDEIPREETTLQRYFSAFQPDTALEAIPGFRARDACGLATLPPHLFRLAPWSPWSQRQLDLAIRAWCRHDAELHGLEDFNFDRHGVAYFGPASSEIHDLEMHRMRSVYLSIRAHGYDRGRGDCRVYLVRRGDQYRAVVAGGGRHRVAAMAALGHKNIPAQFHEPVAVDVRDVTYWPQVRAGVWSEQDALCYVDHLFDFESHSWARSRNLV